MTTEIRNGRVLYPDGAIAAGSLCLEDGLVKGFDLPGDRVVDADGMLVLPGVVDIHGDAFEKIIMPRAGATLPYDIAFREADRQLLSNGISITWEYFRKLRNDREARALLDRFHSLAPHMRCDARAHLRFEIYHTEAVSWVCASIDRGMIDLISFNDHLSYIHGELQKPEKLLELMSRTGLSEVETKKLYAECDERKGLALHGIKAIAARAAAAGVPMASHDEEEAAVRRSYHDIGCRICEFPCNLEAAREAAALGDPIVLGAPNAIKGTSLYNRLSSRQAIADGLCQVLASDYFYPSLVQAAFLCEREGICSLADAWKLIAEGPAHACGLFDRGVLAPGRRADVLLVDDSDTDHPEVAATMVHGEFRYLNAPLRESAFLPLYSR
jgi:alpha-D-ribose 1-methylphosphonate 5-triphosphate diphosphatase